MYPTQTERKLQQEDDWRVAEVRRILSETAENGTDEMERQDAEAVWHEAGRRTA